MNPLEIDVDIRDGAAVARVRGEVDLHSATRFGGDLARAGEGTTMLVVDLSSAGYLDSAGLAVLDTATRAMAERGGVLRLVVGKGSIVYRALDISGLLQTIPTFPDVGSALDGAVAP